jgi:hypothetical protein
MFQIEAGNLTRANFTSLPSTTSLGESFSVLFDVVCNADWDCFDVVVNVTDDSLFCTTVNETNITVGRVSAGSTYSANLTYSCSVTGTYEFMLNATSGTGIRVSDVQNKTISTAGGAYNCDIRADREANSTHVMISVATLSDTGSPENHALTSSCYYANGTSMSSPSFTNVRIGYYIATLATTKGGHCQIRDSGGECGITTVTWHNNRS